MHNFSEFESQIGITFDNKQLLKKAFTHRSYLNENTDVGWDHNERLEFLGDAVLELAVTEYLFDEYPDKPEGELTAIRAAMVNTETISDAAEKLGMEDYLLLSRGQKQDSGRAQAFILGNTFEAVIGAIYRDQGFQQAREFIAETIFGRSDRIVEKKLYRDPKSLFQELAQEHVDITPTYELIDESGPDHNKRFTIGVYLNEEEVARGEGKSKQDAEREAAEKALEEKDW